MIVFSAIKSTDLYKDPLARAKTHPAVIEALGSPIREGFLVSGNTNVNAASGEGNLSIPISGPKEKERFTSRRRNRWAAGTIRGSSWKSKKRIKESIFSEARRRQIDADHSIATRRQELSVSAILLGIFGGLVGVVVGLGLGLVLCSVLATAPHVSPMAGGRRLFCGGDCADRRPYHCAKLDCLGSLWGAGVRRIWLLVGLIMLQTEYQDRSISARGLRLRRPG